LVALGQFKAARRSGEDEVDPCQEVKFSVIKTKIAKVSEAYPQPTTTAFKAAHGNIDSSNLP
jgi:hypothetical protein